MNNSDYLSEAAPPRTGDISVQAFAPHTDWSALADSEHFVQFYETDTFLVNSLSGFIGTGLGAGDACIVVGTGEHREELEAQLQSRGLDLAAARAGGQYLSLDAAETLS